MLLPKLPHNTKTVKRLQDSFGGIDRRPGSINGAIRDAVNMTGDYAPMLAARDLDRIRVNPMVTGAQAVNRQHGLLSAGALYEVYNTKLYRDGVEISMPQGISLTDTDKVMVGLGERVIIWPDKLLYDPRTDPDTQQVIGFKNLESTVTATGLVFEDGTYNGEEAEMNTVTHPTSDFDWADYFKVGDAVHITGCTAEPRNNKTPIIREIDGRYLRFYENVFYYNGDETDDGEADLQGLNGAEEEYTEPGSGGGGSGGEGSGEGSGSGSSGSESSGSGSSSGTSEGETVHHSVTETGSVTLKRECPDLDYMCTNENRVWGCKGDTLWCSKLGDPENWYAFDDVSTASWSTETGTAGNFTGCVTFMGYPCFFKENKVFKVYGSRPQNFELLSGADVGVKEGCAGSMAIASGALYYLSPAGFMQWSGGLPSAVDIPLADLKVTTAAGGSDGNKYWVSLGPGSDWAGDVLCYDPRYGMWHREEYGGVNDQTTVVRRMARHGSSLVIANDFYLRCKGPDPYAEPTGGTMPPWYSEDYDFYCIAEFADFDAGAGSGHSGTFDSKYPVRLWLRAEGSDNGDDSGGWTTKLTVYIRYDNGQWEKAAEYVPGSKGQSYFPVPIRRCGHWALKLEGDGPWKLWAMEQEYYAGTEARR